MYHYYTFQSILETIKLNATAKRNAANNNGLTDISQEINVKLKRLQTLNAAAETLSLPVTAALNPSVADIILNPDPPPKHIFTQPKKKIASPVKCTPKSLVVKSERSFQSQSLNSSHPVKSPKGEKRCKTENSPNGADCKSSDRIRSPKAATPRLSLPCRSVSTDNTKEKRKKTRKSLEKDKFTSSPHLKPELLMGKTLNRRYNRRSGSHETRLSHSTDLQSTTQSRVGQSIQSASRDRLRRRSQSRSRVKLLRGSRSRSRDRIRRRSRSRRKSRSRSRDRLRRGSKSRSREWLRRRSRSRSRERQGTRSRERRGSRSYSRERLRRGSGYGSRERRGSRSRSRERLRLGSKPCSRSRNRSRSRDRKRKRSHSEDASRKRSVSNEISPRKSHRSRGRLRHRPPSQERCHRRQSSTESDSSANGTPPPRSIPAPVLPCPSDESYCPKAEAFQKPRLVTRDLDPVVQDTVQQIIKNAWTYYYNRYYYSSKMNKELIYEAQSLYLQSYAGLFTTPTNFENCYTQLLKPEDLQNAMRLRLGRFSPGPTKEQMLNIKEPGQDFKALRKEICQDITKGGSSKILVAELPKPSITTKVKESIDDAASGMEILIRSGAIPGLALPASRSETPELISDFDTGEDMTLTEPRYTQPDSPSKVNRQRFSKVLIDNTGDNSACHSLNHHSNKLNDIIPFLNDGTCADHSTNSEHGSAIKEKGCDDLMALDNERPAALSDNPDYIHTVDPPDTDIQPTAHQVNPHTSFFMLYIAF